MMNEALELSDHEFKLFKDLVYEQSGIYFNNDKKELVRARLLKRMRALGLNNFNAYYKVIREDRTNEELLHTLDAISTHVSSFFRESKHFDFLENTGLPEVLRRDDSYIHIWSCACSTGEEPYSIAMTIMEALPDYRRYNIRILATDIAHSVLAHAEKGIYTKEKVREVNPIYVQKYFLKAEDRKNGRLMVKPELQQLIQFTMFNLNGPHWPFEKFFDIIFCRNVLIYFDRETQEKLINKLARILKPGGFLLVGHSESLIAIKHDLKYLRPTIYQKK